MSYDSRNLSVLAYANGFTLWHYTTADDAAATVAGNQYFNTAVDMLRVGDIILANVTDGAGIFVVASNDGTDVDLTDMTAVGGSNAG